MAGAPNTATLASRIFVSGGKQIRLTFFLSGILYSITTVAQVSFSFIMQITQTFSWASTTWPSTSPATKYAIFQVYPAISTPLQIVNNTTSATLTFDDSQNLAFQVRPTDGTNYGSEVATFVVNYVPCRSWLRQNIRIALADRTDLSSSSVTTWPDDEINQGIQETLNEFNLLFPLDGEIMVTLLPPTVGPTGVTAGTRNYNLPVDFFAIRAVEYITPDGRLNYWLKEKPFRGGESDSTSYLGYPKLGIIMPPQGGRYYPGHFEIYQGQIKLDFDPNGNGDTLRLRYAAKRVLPTSDADIMSVTPEDMTILSLGAQMKCWLRVESQDTRLSRWRSKEDGSRRDDMPTLRHSQVIKQLYDQRVNDRREQRPKVRRLVRR